MNTFDTERQSARVCAQIGDDERVSEKYGAPRHIIEAGLRDRLPGFLLSTAKENHFKAHHEACMMTVSTPPRPDHDIKKSGSRFRVSLQLGTRRPKRLVFDSPCEKSNDERIWPVPHAGALPQATHQSDFLTSPASRCKTASEDGRAPEKGQATPEWRRAAAAAERQSEREMSMAEQIERLAVLLSAGHLTHAKFKAAKLAVIEQQQQVACSPLPLQVCQRWLTAAQQQAFNSRHLRQQSCQPSSSSGSSRFSQFTCFTCFTRTKVQILAPAGQVRLLPLYGSRVAYCLYNCPFKEHMLHASQSCRASTDMPSARAARARQRKAAVKQQ